MKLIRYIFIILSISTLALTSCRDEMLADPNDVFIGDGYCDLPVKVDFTDLTPALETRAAGNAVHNVDKLWVVIYKVENNTPVFYKKLLANDLAGYTCKQNDNKGNPGDAETSGNIGDSGETTPHATFTLQDMRYGKYQIYAVANIANLSDDDCASPENLKNMSFTWDSEVSKNNAMFGYFTTDDNQKSQGFDAPILIINQNNLSLHAWIKRMVSKVTIKFDATGLKESVRIYIKSVQIKDIPKTCYLGKNNEPTSPDQLQDGEEFKYYDAGDEANSSRDKWKIILSRGSGSNLQGAVNHSEDDPALYFFENMQGNYPGQADYNKVQNPDEVGKPIDKPEDGPDYKDRIPYGTYIEVQAYYVSQNKDKISQGPIKYRFMLGKDITYNYNAERNFHYKLTLKFRGWANEADWHISYTEYSPTVLVHEPYYISYLYNQKLDFPARVILPEDANKSDYYLKAEIIENGWWPYDEANKAIPTGSTGSGIYGFSWFSEAYQNKYSNINLLPSDTEYYTGFAGFLSLQPITREVIGDFGSESYNRTYDYADYSSGELRSYGPNANKWLKKYYSDNKIAEKQYNLGDNNYATYDPIDKSVSLKMPMYTREHQIVPGSDFSGNNPFNCYSRVAKVKFTLWHKVNGEDKKVTFKDGDGKDQTELICRIIQVPRIENPKAIYRAHNNADKFDVKLMILKGAGSQEFVTFKSDGPWRASIMCQTENFITLTDKNGKTVNTTGVCIDGSTDETIEFTYKPSGTIAENETRCGIIKVEYNDYNCVHLIMVRQGYHAPIQFASNSAKWSSYNVYATGKSSDSFSPETTPPTSVRVALTRSPLSIGTYYKRLQYNYGYMEKNETSLGWCVTPSNTSTNASSFTVSYLNGSTYTNGTAVATKTAIWGYSGNGPQGYSWYNSTKTANRWSSTYTWAATWTAKAGWRNNETFTVPTAADYKYLANNCQFGFGVVYADGATETQSSLTKAYGFKDYENTGARSDNGVRACIVYKVDNDNNGKNFLFPLGSLGMGRRTRGNGLLSYGGVTTALGGSENYYRPLVYNLYRVPGATYWFKDAQTKKSGTTTVPDYASWDINYLSLRFANYDSGALWGAPGDTGTWHAGTASDACPIKLIYK